MLSLLLVFVFSQVCGQWRQYCIYVNKKSFRDEGVLKDENDRKPWLHKNANQLKENKISCAFKEMLW